MRLFISTLLACYLFHSYSIAQNVRNIALPLNINDFTIVENREGQMAIRSEKSDVIFKYDTLAPGLPYVGINVVISHSEEYYSVSLSGDEIIMGEDVDLTPNPRYVFSNCINANDVASVKVSYRETIYPGSDVEYVGCSEIGGYKILSFQVCPFRYDAVNKVLSFKNNPVLQLKTKGSKMKGISNHFENMVRNLTVNGDEIKMLYPETYNERSAYFNYEYLIITNTALKPTFQKLADWKTRRGIPAKVLTTEEIAENFTGSTLQAKIKNALKYYYDNSGMKLTYALLGGDVDVVPTQICYAFYGGDERNMPTDLYYACFGTMDWDSNHNGLYGEVDDNVDILPEIYVSRASVSNVSQANIFVNRIISYESNPKWVGNAKKMLMAGTKRDTTFNSNQGIISDTQAQSYYLFYQYVLPYWDGEEVEFYDTHTDFSGDANYDFSATHLQDQLDNGYGFVHVMTHANPFLMRMEPINDYYSIINASSQGNQGETIFITSTCLTNAFDSISSCLSESFIRNPDSGVLAYVGCSRESFGSIDIIYIGPSNTVDGLIMKKIFSLQNKNFARCVLDGKSMCVSNCYSYDSPYRWLYFGINAMGDPEMPIFTTTPMVFDDVIVTYNSNGLYINTNVANCHICVSGRDNTCYLNIEDDNTFVWNNLLDGEYNVCITKPGYIPYNKVFSVNQGIYIQNESLNANTDYMSSNVYVGSDVKPSSTQGQVTIGERTKVKINASNGVLIKNDFVVKVGATFEITQ